MANPQFWTALNTEIEAHKNEDFLEGDGAFMYTTIRVPNQTLVIPYSYIVYQIEGVQVAGTVIRYGSQHEATTAIESLKNYEKQSSSTPIVQPVHFLYHDGSPSLVFPKLLTTFPHWCQVFQPVDVEAAGKAVVKVLGQIAEAVQHQILKGLSSYNVSLCNYFGVTEDNNVVCIAAPMGAPGSFDDSIQSMQFHILQDLETLMIQTLGQASNTTLHLLTSYISFLKSNDYVGWRRGSGKLPQRLIDLVAFSHPATYNGMKMLRFFNNLSRLVQENGYFQQSVLSNGLFHKHILTSEKNVWRRTWQRAVSLDQSLDAVLNFIPPSQSSHTSQIARVPFHHGTPRSTNHTLVLSKYKTSGSIGLFCSNAIKHDWQQGNAPSMITKLEVIEKMSGLLKGLPDVLFVGYVKAVANGPQEFVHPKFDLEFILTEDC